MKAKDVEVSTREFVYEKDKLPRGEGLWAFRIGKEVVWFEGGVTDCNKAKVVMYGEAKRQAQEYAAKKGISRIVVLS